MVRWKPCSSSSRSFPLWDATTPGEPAHKPQLIEVNLSGIQSESITTAIQTPQSTPILPLPPVDTAKPSSDIAAAINLQLMGTLA